MSCKSEPTLERFFFPIVIDLSRICQNLLESHNSRSRYDLIETRPYYRYNPYDCYDPYGTSDTTTYAGYPQLNYE